MASFDHRPQYNLSEQGTSHPGRHAPGDRRIVPSGRGEGSRRSLELMGFEPRTVSDPFSRLIGELLNVAPFMDPSTLESLRRLLSYLAPTPFCPKTAAPSGGER